MLKPFTGRSRHGGTTDFACQYCFVTALQWEGETIRPSGDAFYVDARWQTLTDAYAPMLKRSDIAADILPGQAPPAGLFSAMIFQRAPCLHLRRGRRGFRLPAAASMSRF